MKQKKVKLGISLLLGLCFSNVNAQQETTATGGDATGIGGSVNHSVGQLVYTTDNSPTGTISQGVQQPYEIYTLSTASFDNTINITYTAYPNPTTGFLILKVSDFTNENLMYQLFDINGKLIKNSKIDSTETNIVMENNPAATYFLKITTNNKEVKTFKIIKN